MTSECTFFYAAAWQTISARHPENILPPPSSILASPPDFRSSESLHSLLSVPCLGSLVLLQHGAEVIYDTDDDNILLDWAARDPWLGFLANQTLPLQALEYMARPDR